MRREPAQSYGVVSADDADKPVATMIASGQDRLPLRLAAGSSARHQDRNG